ncbi:MAG TPA: sugar ABC transporter ATP-binding protein [Lachnospiraceae bacterium]
MNDEKYILSVSGIEKSFAGVAVLKGAELHVKAGEIHALMGENGAGKSTLMKIIMGIYSKDAGEIFLDGHSVCPHSSREALSIGISMIHQELSPIPEMTVSENIFLGREKRKYRGLPIVDKKYLNDATWKLLEKYNLNEFIKPTMKMKHLNIAQIQMMEILKAISYDSKVIIMDEPTSSLTEKETEILFSIIDRLKKQNVGIIYISHRMEEVFQLSDRISVLRDGSFIGCVETKAASREELVNMMVGRELEGGYPKNTVASNKIVLSIRNFNKKGVFKDVNFDLHQGEILGFYGLVGAGRSEVMRALVGYDRKDSGEIRIDGKIVKINHSEDAIKNHIIMTPEDRKMLGLALCRSIKENVSVQNYDKISRLSFIRKRKERELVKSYVDDMSTKMNSIEDLVSSLSGGNQQKVVLAKSLLSNPKVLIMDEPTRGIDVGAKSAIYKIMVDLAKKGIAIIMISSELPELIGMSDRIIVMANGMIRGVLSGEEARSQNIIVNYAFGGNKDVKEK